jgi:hypothetical protein
MSNSISPEAHTLAFLRLLDPGAKVFAFRVLPEGSGNSVKPHNHRGKIADLRPILEKQNRNSGGVFVTVNEGGQRADEITRVRAVFADTDGAPLEPIKAALTPHIIVESSPKRWHVYWLVRPDFPLDQFGSVQTAIAKRFGSDPIVKDLPRIMRLPGFLHMKSAPHLCSLVEINRNLPRHSLDDIVQGLSLNLNSTVKPELTPRVTDENCADLEEVARALSHLNPFVPRDQWLAPIQALAHAFGENGRDLAHRWSRGDLWNGGRDGRA